MRQLHVAGSSGIATMSGLELLLRELDQAYDRKSWHGTNLRGSIRGLTANQAVWRPGRGRHNIQEIVVHAAYWKYTVRRRFTGESRGSFPLAGSNWFPRTRPDETLWKADVRLLDEMHRTLRLALAALPPEQLALTPARSTVSNSALVSGIIAHDLYHAGQIQLLKKLRNP
jgi:uncharacterized damage-inducible protein DinB